MRKYVISIACILFIGTVFGQSPGGVGDLALWLKANAGTSTTTDGSDVNSWDDQGGNDDASGVAGDRPSYVANGINFNPALNFDQSNDEEMAGNGGFYSTAYYLVARPDNTLNTGSTNEVIVGFDVPTGGGVNQFGGFILGTATSAFAGEIITHAIGGSGTRWRRGITGAAFGDINAGTTYLFSVRDNAGGTSSELYVDGLEQADLNSGTFLTTSDEAYEVGSYTSANTFDTDGHFNGQIAEIITFSTRPSDAEHNRIESYLAIKYGFTLDNSAGGTTGDLLRSSGDVVWDASVNAIYHNRVTAIGRDDNSDLNQKQSASEDASKLLSIGLGEVAATNAANSNSFSANNSFFVVGDDDGAISGFSSTGAPSGYEILERTWKVQETGTVGDVAFQIPDNSSTETVKLPALSAGKTLMLLVDADGDFSSGSTAYLMGLNGTNWETAADIADGQFFTFAQTDGAVLEVSLVGDEEGPVSIEFTVTLPGINGTGSAITFDFDDAGSGSAISGSDYTAVGGSAQISVADGAVTGTTSVTVLDDATQEPTETMTATISNSSLASLDIETASAAANIIDNDGTPGGVSSNFVFWLKANVGTSSTVDGANLTDWDDQTSNGNDASDAGSNDPQYESVLANFNPAIDFTASNDRGFSISNVNDINGATSTRKSYTIAFRTSSDVTTRQFIYEEGGGTHGMNLFIESGTISSNIWMSQVDYAISGSIEPNTDYVLTYIYDGPGGESNTYLNGQFLGSNSSVANSFPAHGDGVGIGNINGGTQIPPNDDENGNQGFNGYVMEMAYYNETAHTTVERNRVESYLALKYGIDLDGNMTASDGVTSIWNNTLNIGYDENVSGIGLDGPSILNQKQSKSVGDGSLVSIGLGAVASSNAANTNSFSADYSFLVWGHNNAGLVYSETNTPEGRQTLDRIWRVQETGTVGSVFISVPAFGSSESVKLPSEAITFLLVDDDGDFSSGATEVALTLNGTNWEGTIDFTTGQYFTFAIGGAELLVTQVGLEDNDDLIFTVTLPETNTTGSPITFDLDDLGTGTATSGTDYVAISGSAQISVANGSSTGSLTVSVIDDPTLELTETVDVIIRNSSNPSLYPIVDSLATGSIEDNDALGPGGVNGDIEGWYKADLGPDQNTDDSSLNSWSDQSGNGLDLSEINGGGTPENPTYQLGEFNFNPIVRFTDPGNTNASYFTTASNPLTSDMTLIAVFATTQNEGGTDHYNAPAIIGADHGGNGDNYALGTDLGRVHAKIESGDSYGAQTTGTFNDGIPYIATATREISGNTVLYINGQSEATDVSDAVVLDDPDAIGIGNQESFATASQFAGDIAEVLLYSNDLTAANQLQVESYLAIKYGISLSANYTASDASVIWDATANSDYLNDITAIGQDINSGLNQKQSKSVETSALITLGLDEIITINQLNSSVFAADKSFVIIGDDGGNLTLSSTGVPAAVQRIGRTWKVQETGTVGTVLLQIPSDASTETIKLPSASEFNLLVDTDDDFSSGATLLPMTLVNNNWEVEVDFTTGQFFTFGTGSASLSATVNGNETGPVNVEFTVTLTNTNSSGSDLTFDFDDLGTGSATSGADYLAVDGAAQIVVSTGNTSGTFSITVNDDAFLESIETIDVQISNSSSDALYIENATATGTIEDNDNSDRGPGGVFDDLAFWFRADSGTNTTTNGGQVTSWEDQSDNSFDASTSVTAPLFQTVGTNFNPGIDFSNATTGGLTTADDNIINTSNFGAKSYVVVFTTGADISTNQVVYEQGGGTNGLNIYIASNNLVTNVWNNSADNPASTPIEANTTYVATYVFDGSNSRTDLYLNGVLMASDANVFATLSSHSGDVGIGVIDNTTQFNPTNDVSDGAGLDGSLMEIVHYNEKALSYEERNRIESYLALKYGITLESSYASAGGSVVWDSLANFSYRNDIAGITQDIASVAKQTQSVSNNSDAFVTIGLGAIASDNASNLNTFATGNDFLIWGNDNDDLVGQTSNASLTAESGEVDFLSRIWKVVETNIVDTVQLAIPVTETEAAFAFSDYGNYALKIADDASFTTNVEYVDFASSFTNINGTDYFTCDIDFDGTKYFTIAQRGFIIWTGTEWRGGLSTITDHFPSDETGDTSKTIYVLSGDTASMTEPVEVAELSIEASAVLQIESTNCLKVRNTVTNNGNLDFLADASGYAQYKGPAVEATFQQYIDNNGWHLIGSPFSDATFDDFSFLDSNGFVNHPVGGASLDSCDYCNMWYYDASTDNGTDIGFGSSDAFGTWRTSTNGSQAFAPDRGWNLFLDDASGFYTAPWTVEVSGVFNNGDITQTVNENNAGWNLVANPYPSVIDWDIIDDDLAAAGIAGGYHIWDEENTNYITYAAGVGSLDNNNFIAPFQGFYVQTSVVGAQGGSNVFRSFELENDDRPDICSEDAASYYKVQSDRDIVRLRTTHASSGKQDETILILDPMASRGYNAEEDIHKLLTRYSDVPSVYIRQEQENFVINSMPLNADKDSVRVSCKVKGGSMVKIEAIDPPEGYTLYLEDIKTSVWHRIDEEPLTFRQDERFQNRFWLHFSKMAISPSRVWNDDKPFYTYIKDDVLYIRTQKSLLNADWVLSNVNGQVVKSGRIVEDDVQEYAVPINKLVPGAYFLMLQTYDKRYSEKLLKF